MVSENDFKKIKSATPSSSMRISQIGEGKDAQFGDGGDRSLDSSVRKPSVTGLDL